MLPLQRTPSHARTFPVLPLLLLLTLPGCGGGPDVSAGDRVESVLALEEAGLSSPRAAIHDPVADVYLVSNMAGDRLDQDNNGFISRVSPDGEMLEAQWVAPFDPRGPLSAPSGMAILGEVLYVADIDCIAIYDRASGIWDGRNCLQGVTVLSGLAVGPEGSVFATDSGAGPGGAGAGTAAVYRLLIEEGQRGTTIAQGVELGHPWAVDVGSRGIFVASGDPGQILRFTPEGARTTVMTLPDEDFEGITFTAEGGFAYTSSSDQAVYLVDASGSIHVLMEGIGHPGDLGYDATRNRLLVPITDQDRLLMIDLL